MSAQEALQAVSKSNLNFTTSIYKVLAQNEGNLFFSPISIEVILALTYMGAGGKTAQQMLEGLHLPKDKEVAKSGFNALISSLTSVEKVTLAIANKIFADARVTLHDDFHAIARKHFLSDVENVDFYTKADASRVTINKWVESKTNNKIKDLLPSGVLDSSTVMVLVNAVYFKGNWANKFDPARTDTQPFYVTATETKDVQMMHKKAKFGYTHRDDLDAKVLQMPYDGDQLSLVIILPNAVDGLAKLEAKLPEVSLVEIVSELGRPEVEVSLPKFKLEQSFDLKEVLQKLGMVDMFEDSADFSTLLKDGPPVKVSKVIHKAFIEVNEEGSEAAAATASVMRLKRSLMTDEYKFTANHPFLFLVCDKKSRHMLFVGRLTHVTSEPHGGGPPSKRDEL